MSIENTFRRSRVILIAAAAMMLVVALSSCSIKELAMNVVIDALSGGDGAASALTGDDDPEFVGDALPFALKLYEILLTQSPENEGLLLTTGSGFVMYANAYLQSPADLLPDEEYELRQHMRDRAKKMYLRGRDYVLDAIELRHRGFLAATEDGDIGAYLAGMTEEDMPFLYWGGLGWVAAISIDSFDVSLGFTRELGVSLLERALEIDETYSSGGIHEFFISYYGGLPEILGGSQEKARYHFEKAIEISEGKKPGPYVALATAVSIKNQDADEFRSLLETAVALEIDDPDNQLVTIVTQRKARWLLDHIDRYFFIL